MFSPVAACMQVSVMIVALLLVRACFARIAPPVVFLACWWLVLARALIPLFPMSQAKQVVDMGTAASRLAQQGDTAAVPLAVLNPSAPLWDMPDLSGLLDTLIVVWAGVAAVLSAVLVAVYARDRWTLAKKAVDVGDDCAGMQHDFESRLIRRHIRVVEVDGLQTPISYGVFRPTVAFPTGFRCGVSDAQLTLVLRHELAHVRHFDTLIKPLAAFATCLYWFDPLMWLAFFSMQTDMEKAADEWALRGCSRKETAMYARSLLNAKSASSNLTCALGATSLETRIKAILAPKPRLLVCVLSCILVLTCCFGSLAFASVAIPADPDQTTVTVCNGSYSFDIPAYWKDRVSVATDGKSTFVYPTGYPELVLASFSMAEDVDEADVTEACPIVYEAPCGNGQTLVIRVMNYLDMAAGDLWHDAYAANPSYPGAEGEELAVDLSTLGNYSAKTAHAMSGVHDVRSGHPQVVNLVAEALTSTLVIE